MKTEISKSPLISKIEAKAQLLMDFTQYNPADYIEDYRGRAVYTCLWVPPELLRMGGYQPVLLRGKFTPPSAGSFDCCRCSSIEEVISSNSIPDVKFLAVADTCSQIMKAAFRLSQSQEITLFYIQEPKGQDDDSLRKYVHHLNWLRESVSTDISNSVLTTRFEKACEAYNSIRKLLETIRLRNNISSEVFYTIQAVTQTAPYELTIPFLAEIDELTKGLEPITACPVMLVGGALGIDEVEIAEMITNAGGFVAADLLCSSGRSMSSPGTPTGKLTFESLALEYFNRLPCMPVQPNRRFYEHLEHLMEQRNIRGLLYYKPENCTSYEIEHERVMWKTSVPVLLIDGKFMRLERAEKSTLITEFIGNISL